MRIKFEYRNHRGDINTRDVTVHNISYLVEPGFGYEPGWFLNGYDHNRAANRSFKFENIIAHAGTLELIDLTGLPDGP